jgi:NADH-quinone oxidoreductase E subunit
MQWLFYKLYRVEFSTLLYMIEFASNTNFAPSNPKAEKEIFTKLGSERIKTRIEALLKQYPARQGALLEILWIAQSELGWVPQAAVKWAAQICECSPAHAWGVATFYTMYKHIPTGRFLLQFCQNICCHVASAENIISMAEEKLGIKAGETTEDNLFTIVRVECLGACGNGPVMLVNDDFATDVVDGNLAMPLNVGLNEERLDKVIAWCRDRASKMPQEPERDPIGGITNAIHGEPLGLDFAPAPPALGVKATSDENGVSIVWKIASEVTSLTVERKNGSKWEAIGNPSVKDKEFVDTNGKSGCEYRIIATSDKRVAKPSAISIS